MSDDQGPWYQASDAWAPRSAEDPWRVPGPPSGQPPDVVEHGGSRAPSPPLAAPSPVSSTEPTLDLFGPGAYAPPVPPGPGALYQQTDPLGNPPRRRPSLGWLLAAGLVLALVAGGAGGVAGYRLATRSTDTGLTDSGASLGAVPSGSLSRPPDSVAGIAQRVLPTVVSIEVTSASGGGTGSGFVIRADGYVLTNNHVATAAGPGGSLTVQFNDGRTVDAEVVGTSPSYDLAVLKVARTGLPVAVLGDSDSVVVGDEVIAVGSPLGLAGTVTSGIISAKDRPVTTGVGDGSEPSFISALQTDAAINPGNSGGPLVDGQARVIGVNSAIAALPGASQSGSIGLGFSIPINQARRVAEQIIRTGVATYPVIGVSLDSTFAGDGARVAQVTPGGPGAAAGLQPGDVIIGIDGQPAPRADELIVDIRRNQPGDTVTLTYRRAGRERTAQVVLGSAEG